MVKRSIHTYVVEMELELCSCSVGETGVPCKDQSAVAKVYSCQEMASLEMRVELAKLKSGDKANI